MGSLLVQTTFVERVVGILVLRSGKRSSENGVQTTFGLGRKGSSLERLRATRRHARGLMKATVYYGLLNPFNHIHHKNIPSEKF